MELHTMPASVHVRELQRQDLLAEAARAHLMDQAFSTAPRRQRVRALGVQLAFLLSRIRTQVVGIQRHPRMSTPDLLTLVTD